MTATDLPWRTTVMAILIWQWDRWLCIGKRGSVSSEQWTLPRWFVAGEVATIGYHLLVPRIGVPAARQWIEALLVGTCVAFGSARSIRSQQDGTDDEEGLEARG